MYAKRLEHIVNCLRHFSNNVDHHQNIPNRLEHINSQFSNQPEAIINNQFASSFLKQSPPSEQAREMLRPQHGQRYANPGQGFFGNDVAAGSTIMTLKEVEAHAQWK